MPVVRCTGFMQFSIALQKETCFNDKSIGEKDAAKFESESETKSKKEM